MVIKDIKHIAAKGKDNASVLSKAKKWNFITFQFGLQGKWNFITFRIGLQSSISIDLN
jgi:hypothetical protein